MKSNLLKAHSFPLLGNITRAAETPPQEIVGDPASAQPNALKYLLFGDRFSVVASLSSERQYMNGTDRCKPP
jgi:hypothetical protein